MNLTVNPVNELCSRRGFGLVQIRTRVNGWKKGKSQNRNSSEVIICQNVKMVVLNVSFHHRKTGKEPKLSLESKKERKINDDIMCLLANIHALYTTPLFCPVLFAVCSKYVQLVQVQHTLASTVHTQTSDEYSRQTLLKDSCKYHSQVAQHKG